VSLTQTLANMRTNVRRFSDAGGTTALVRHPDADLNDYINRGLGSLYRKLTEAVPDQRFLSTTTINLVASTTTYALPADFDSLISVDLTANGVKVWLVAYEMHERPALTDPATSYQGVPFCYRLRGANIEYLPTPSSSYTSSLWYVPNVTTLAVDAATFDTISRLDDYVIAYASRFVAVRDKNWDLASMCKSMCAELEDEIVATGRMRDRNSPSRVVDERQANRWGRYR
jgi:hypothetical protein